jgi:hypothetical protein
MLKIGSWLIGIGCCFALAGLCFLPAGFGLHPDNALLAAGAMLFSMGMVLAASGFYVKARSFSPAKPATGNANANIKTDRKGTRKVCTLCSKQEAVIQCRPHEAQLCGQCVSKHYDYKSCTYIPMPRPATTKEKARSQATSA